MSQRTLTDAAGIRLVVCRPTDSTDEKQLNRYELKFDTDKTQANADIETQCRLCGNESPLYSNGGISRLII